ncbi:MAG: ABC transporter substrate-binding protein [Mesorhizobium sp.]|uniref:ABC transporter substrate-binding protein n=1 Tax=Mesorhizobium sp. TaxID=1871066 RepID=UPI000FE92D8E|nr:ABC transporter substrate-binding protein [Mesorhizobium sp.]RWF77920.1 MAG: ABC transporter substrate-binding protein [Mesorhizobium sp.]TIS68521.1 MAG: ABC transporter substrate-binding protein [Mesorhizobium sp.]TIW51077.1 MAG: ABC transporter substrate-binding protein [Mesorhizobium sp.]
MTGENKLRDPQYNKMVEEAIAHGATRRDLLRFMMLGGAAAAMGTSIFSHATPAFAQTPVRGGSLKAAAAVTSTAETLDPAKSGMVTDFVRCCSLYNRLTILGSDGRPKMELAESVETDDAKVWTVKLRKGVTFHDGRSLTSADVVFSLKRHLDPAVGSKVNSIAKQMTDFKAVDDQTVEITLESANADLPTILALNHFHIVADGTTDFSKGNGTGPFKLDSFEPGVRSLMTRNPNYWKPNLPYLDSFEFFAISDDTARVNAVLSGDVQYAGIINPRSLPQFENQPNVKASTSSSGSYTNLISRLDMNPGDKAGFVTGLKYLMNRELIQKAVFRGTSEIANDQPIDKASIYFNPEVKPKAYDPDQAKFHFKKAGLLGTPISMVASETAYNSIDIAVILQQSAEEIGMKLDVKRVPSDGYWSNYWLKEAVHFGHWLPRPTPDIIFSIAYSSNAAWNESRYKSEKFDNMLLEARGLLNEAKRKQIYGEMQMMVSEDAGTVIPAFKTTTDAMSSKLHGFESSPLGPMMGGAFAEYVWLEA